jgi:hypothetical protein
MNSLFKRLKAVPIHAWWLLPFILAEVILASYGFTTFHGPLSPLTYAEPLRPFLVGADITVAVFAVNFSLLAVQLSPYRGVLRDLNPRLLAGAAFTLLLALVPVLTTAFSPNWTATVALLTLPALAYMVVFLSVVARTQASAKPQIARLSSEASINRFIQVFADGARAVDKIPPELIKSDGTPPPVHEIGWQIYPVAISYDPLNELCTINALAADAADLSTYIESLNAILRSVDSLHRKVLNRADRAVFAAHDLLLRHAADTLNRAAAIRPSWDNTGIIAHRFTHACAAFLSTDEFSLHPRSAFALMITKAMTIASKALIKMNVDDPAVDTIVVARRVALSGAQHSPDDVLERVEHHNTLAGQARIMQELGEAAVTERNAAFFILVSMVWDFSVARLQKRIIRSWVPPAC